MSGKKALILDSSSAILLEKSDLLNELLDDYQVILTEAVFRELTMNAYPSADVFHAKFQDSAIDVEPLSADLEINDHHMRDLATMGLGEAETIKKYLSGRGDFVMLDDGRGARFCLKQQIPFINALLFPKILYFADGLSWEDYLLKTGEIKRLGRYSRNIIRKAQDLSRSELSRFFP
jgi:hypothetical protein